MPRIKINGVIIPNDYQRIYDYFEWDATSPKKVEQALNEDDDDVIVEINSGGGSVFDGSEIYTLLKEHPKNITVKIMGVAASAASVIAMAGDNILMSPTSQMMIHNATSVSIGDYRNMETATNLLKNANQTAINAYKIKSGMSDDELKEMMDKETWFTAHQALENKLINEIMFEEQVQIAASFGNGLLPQSTIKKLTEILFKQEKPTNDKSDFLMTKLKLLKLKGDVKE